MFDQIRDASAAFQAPSSDRRTSYGGATQSPADHASDAVFVWLRWDGVSVPFVRAVQLSARLENFRFIDAQRTLDEVDVWRCRFETAETAPDLDRRSEALLRRLGLIAPLVRAERGVLWSAPVDEDDDEHLWDAFARRPLP